MAQTDSADWPELPLHAWRPTMDTLHRWTQIVGKVRLALAPRQNHWWHVALYVTPRGMTTSAVPHGRRTFQVDFDFLAHEVRIVVSDGSTHVMPLAARSVASFYGEFMAALHGLGLDVRVWTVPQEVEDTTPFDRDEHHRDYDPEYARRFGRALVQIDRVLQQFRAEFIGKSSPVHFFWGSFDLALTRFSGRSAPPHPGGIPGLADWVTREAYSHEVSSIGFWPGGGNVDEPAFFAYIYPEPDGFASADVGPAEARYDRQLREFILPYEAVRRAADPDAALLEFCRSSYAAAARLAGWERQALEWP